MRMSIKWTNIVRIGIDALNTSDLHLHTNDPSSPYNYAGMYF